MNNQSKIILTGGAGLVGQNLIARLIQKGYTNITVIDKKAKNLEILKKLQPIVNTIEADLSEPGSWSSNFDGSEVVVMLQAQIGGLDYQEFQKNNIDATRLILAAIRTKKIPYLVHVSSSVVNTSVDDFYTSSKKIQEEMVLNSGISCPILRPTLMFGFFDRKHLGWLSRFMNRNPIFPIPGNGEYIRQPLYVGDFCNIIISCIENHIEKGIYNISGQEKIYYIDIIKKIKDVTKAKCAILRIPYFLFYFLLWTWALFDKKPPFTTQQLKALVEKDEFEIIDWPGIFNVSATPFSIAVKETFTDQDYSKIELEF